MALLQDLSNGQLAGLNAGAGLLGSVINGAFGIYNNRKNLEFQQQANEQNIAFQRETNLQNIDEQWKMWEATNAYNHPAAQMSRYREAGLNPNLIYGQSNTAQSNNVGTAVSPKAEAKHQEKIQLATDASLYMDLLLKAEEVQSKKIENDIQGSISDDIKAKSGWEAMILQREFERLGIDLERGNIDNAIRSLDKIIRQNDVNNIGVMNRLLSNQLVSSDNSISMLRYYNDIIKNEKLLSDYSVNNAEYYKKYQRGLEYQKLSNEITEQMRQMERNLKDYPISHNILKHQEKRSGFQSSNSKLFFELLGGAVNLIPLVLLLSNKNPKTVKGFGGKY